MQNAKPNTSPFLDNDPEFNIARIESSHRLILNKFCAVRPQFVLPTAEYRSQEEFLNQTDFQAAWSVVRRLRSPFFAIYNCGINAGRSVEHKHLQVLPQPEYLERAPFVSTEGHRAGQQILYLTVSTADKRSRPISSIWSAVSTRTSHSTRARGWPYIIRDLHKASRSSRHIFWKGTQHDTNEEVDDDDSKDQGTSGIHVRKRSWHGRAGMVCLRAAIPTMA